MGAYSHRSGVASGPYGLHVAHQTPDEREQDQDYRGIEEKEHIRLRLVLCTSHSTGKREM